MNFTSSVTKLLLLTAVAAFGLAACAANTGADEDVQQADGTTQDLKASSCKGMLPHICEVCSDGASACAHWVVKHKKCEVEVCASAPACVQNVLCAINEHFDHASCKCVAN